MRPEDVVESQSNRLYRLAYLYMKESQAAEDAVQEAFMRYVRESTAIHNPGAWLSRVVRNNCLAELRKRRREQYVDPMEMPEVASTFFDEQVTEALRMSDALLRLPLVYREALVWRYYAEVPDQEIAESLGLSESGLRTRLTRARRALARLLKEEEE